jgi:hypothetical protein
MDDEIRDMVRKILYTQGYHLEMMAAAFIKVSGLNPMDCELVQENRGNEVVFYFRERTDVK